MVCMYRHQYMSAFHLYLKKKDEYVYYKMRFIYANKRYSQYKFNKFASVSGIQRPELCISSLRFHLSICELIIRREGKVLGPICITEKTNMLPCLIYV
uniref:Uncharacterized protein n=1 Tax=Pyxicephalus adspersus TaxID=30357 RepID=A0AAV3AXH1_PYXAD|nr:TPA: hypothetical protein GDO54_001317 [Pyxicephalus adspersus]